MNEGRRRLLVVYGVDPPRTKVKEKGGEWGWGGWRGRGLKDEEADDGTNGSKLVFLSVC